MGLCEFSICMSIDDFVFRKVVGITCSSYQDYSSDLEQVFLIDFYLLLLECFALLGFGEAIFM